MKICTPYSFEVREGFRLSLGQKIISRVEEAVGAGVELFARVSIRTSPQNQQKYKLQGKYQQKAGTRARRTSLEDCRM